MNSPDIKTDLDWVFPDTKEGIQDALDLGASTFWLNTVLYKNHDIESFFNLNIEFIGQKPEQVDVYDDKYLTNELLRKNEIPVPKTTLISIKNLTYYELGIDFPLVITPIRGRGNQSVSLVKTIKELDEKLNKLFLTKDFENAVYVERFLSG